MDDQHQRLVELLDREFRGNGSFVRIHAAELLAEHGFGSPILEALRRDTESAEPGYRVGVWRVLSRIVGGEEQERYRARIRGVMADPRAPDRLVAAESLAKLRAADRADRVVIEEWLRTADDSTAPFPLWLLLQSSTAAERSADEARLAAFLEASDALARLRSSYALGREGKLTEETKVHLAERVPHEPSNTIARIYVIGANLLLGTASEALRDELLHFLKGGLGNEQFEAANVLGMVGTVRDLSFLQAALDSSEVEGRIGAAGALLRLPA